MRCADRALDRIGDAGEFLGDGSEPALQLLVEQQVGQLGLPIGGDPVVVAFPLQIVEVDLGLLSVTEAAHGHYPRIVHRQ